MLNWSEMKKMGGKKSAGLTNVNYNEIQKNILNEVRKFFYLIESHSIQPYLGIWVRIMKHRVRIVVVAVVLKSDYTSKYTPLLLLLLPYLPGSS